MRVVWTKESKITLNRVIDFIYVLWSEKEVSRFLARTNQLITTISEQPYLFKQWEDSPQIRHGILHKNVTLFYRVLDDQKVIELILFWDNRKNPDDLKL